MKQDQAAAAETPAAVETVAPGRRVNGLLVTASAPEESPLPRRRRDTGGPITYPWLLMTLEDGSTIRGCMQCDFTGKRREIAAHVKEPHPDAEASGKKPDKQQHKGISSNVWGTTLGELLRFGERFEEWEEQLLSLQERLRAESGLRKAAEEKLAAETGKREAAEEKLAAETTRRTAAESKLAAMEEIFTKAGSVLQKAEE